MSRKAPNVVLIALDTQRADHLGCYGYDRPVSPNIDAIAAQGVLFEKCIAPNIPTHPSFSTMFSGKEAVNHGIVNIGGGVPIREDVRLLPEILSEAGYVTGAADNMGRHFPRGYDHYRSFDWDHSDPTVLAKAKAVNEQALPLLDELMADERPFFCFMHYWDPHTPLLPPKGFRDLYYPKDRDEYDVNNHSMDEAWSWEPFKWYFHDWMPGITDADYVVNLYDGEVTYMDQMLAQVFDKLGPVREETLLIITGDHGEILNDQLGYFDHHGLYDANVRVPLIMSLPGTLPKGTRVPGMVQNVDFAQTILDFAGVPQRDGMEGISLLPCLYGARDGNYDEVFLSEATWQVKRGVRTDKWKLIRSVEQDRHDRPMVELFDLESDPTEQKNLAETDPATVKELSDKLDAWIAKRLAETGRDVDPVAQQGMCATQIGKPIEGAIVGAGATPLHERVADAAAATVPDPSSLNAGKD